VSRTVCRRAVIGTLSIAVLFGAVGGTVASAAEQPPIAEKSAAERLCDAAGVTGGLCVLVDCRDTASVVALAKTGRYLIHVLESDAEAVESARRELHKAGLYGIASVERLDAGGKLPYTENLVNAVFLGEKAIGPARLAEINRVLRPQGVVFTEGRLSALPGWQDPRKPWPPQMDQWTHPRYAANGNAVSHDALVAPPRRVRWVTGPQQEISNMVTADGRCFFAGVLARDAFNGLRLWQQQVEPSPARGGYMFQSKPGSVRPVAVGNRLLVVSNGKLQALDAATGRPTVDYPNAGTPTEILVVESRAGILPANNSASVPPAQESRQDARSTKTILAINKDSLRAVDLAGGQLRWKHDAKDARYVVAGDGNVCFIHGDPRRGEPVRLACLDLAEGKLRWEQADLPWLAKVRQLTYHGGLLACEMSTLNDEKAGNILQVLAAADGKPLWSREFPPGSTHWKQARAMFVGDKLWVHEWKKAVGLDARTGEVKNDYPAGSGHCFPPVATEQYLFGGEMDLTNLVTGDLDANPITKMACSRDAGVVPANGLLYTAPKHCICWPMLRDYSALAPERPGGIPNGNAASYVPEPGPALAPENVAAEDAAAAWPCYRHDALRSGSTTADVPHELKVAWTATLGDRPTATIAEDWRQNYFIRGPVGPPVAAGGAVFVARPDAHQVVALDAASGNVRWTFTANGRVDTAPTIHRGLCLFGCKSGWVYCLRADDGCLVWRLRAAPLDERIVAYGQIESPWPVPGSVLVVDDAAYFAAGRQSLADGGIRVFCVEPATGKVRWTQRLDSVPQKAFYASSGLEFDNFDIMHREGDAVAMSRWLFDRADGRMTCAAKIGFARLATNGSGGVMFPRGSWSYAPRNETERSKERPFLRPLAAFAGNTLFCCTQDRQSLFRRDFDLDGGEQFDAEWFHGWNTYKAAGKGGDLWQSQRLAHDAKWTLKPLEDGGKAQPISAMVLAGNAVYVVGAEGRLAVLDPQDGRTLGRLDVPPPAWDGLAAAGGRLYLTTQDGRVVCLMGK